MQTEQRFSALYSRDFRLFWFGQVISLSGTWMQSVAQSWLVYSLTKSPLYLGIIASVASFPILCLTLIGGMVADRYPKRSILILTQALSAMPALILGVLTYTDTVTVLHVGILAAFLGTVNAFDIPARQAFLAEVVEKSAITNAIALNSAAFNGARIIGPVIAGIVISSLGIPACFFLNAISFIAVIFALLRIAARGTIATHRASFFKEIAGGRHFVVTTKPILYIMTLISLFSLFGIPYMTLLPVLAGEVFNAGARGLSLLVASAGAGSLLAAVFIAFKGKIEREDIFIPISGLIFSAAILALSFSRNFYISLLSIFAAGWGIVGYLAACNSYIQNRVPDALRGRVMSLYTLVFLGFAPLGNLFIGFTAEAAGSIASLKIFALVCILGSIIFFRQFRRKVPDYEVAGD
ncbi:MAG TPA: MFS transporter [Dissulfurispiraceae bacterium]|nr:MFS transporter [Dissulfurispiraceae bacterium]